MRRNDIGSLNFPFAAGPLEPGAPAAASPSSGPPLVTGEAPPPSTSPAITEVTFRGFAFTNVTSMLLLAGATASLYGPLLSSIAEKFHLSLPRPASS